jgi:[ribosomal protein S18]-alanine N-acetyltransferase
MRIPFVSGPTDYAIVPLDVSDAAAVADIHDEDFVRPWSAEEFATLLKERPVFGFGARATGRPRAPLAGFVLARVAAGEAEILTIAVARTARRAGLGRRLMDAVLRHLHHLRAEALFLEVDEANHPALALYRRLGFREVGRRENYYDGAEGRKSSALVMRRDLR